MGEYQNDFAEWPTPDASWMADITIAVPYDVEINHYIAQERLHGVIDNLRERLAEAEGKFEHERFENSRLHGDNAELRGENARLLEIVDRLTAGGDCENKEGE